MTTWFCDAFVSWQNGGIENANRRLRRWLPRQINIDRVSDEVWTRTALLWLNSPHNPTGSVLDRARLERVAALARRFGFWVGADEAYAEVWFEGAPHSMLECGTENVIAKLGVHSRLEAAMFVSQNHILDDLVAAEG